MSVIDRAKHAPARSDSIGTLLGKLEMVSHAPISAYGRQTPDSGEDIGGKRPPGSDAEYKPRPPKSPRREGDAQSQKAWDEYEDDLAAWLACYHRRTPAYFRRRLDQCGSYTELCAIRVELRETIKAWCRAPLPLGQEPEYGSPQWKRYIAQSREDAGVLATRFSVTRRYINMIRAQYREVT